MGVCAQALLLVERLESVSDALLGESTKSWSPPVVTTQTSRPASVSARALPLQIVTRRRAIPRLFPPPSLPPSLPHPLQHAPASLRLTLLDKAFFDLEAPFHEKYDLASLKQAHAFAHDGVGLEDAFLSPGPLLCTRVLIRNSATLLPSVHEMHAACVCANLLLDACILNEVHHTYIHTHKQH